ncbi:hypothetical protein V6N12_022619 [Hibiscus sabdariffa]|uniref:Protein-serine/threonine phosphatase n=1 Tax=Hibiscus sabdariffa TaxID=183260 RepID=A0ABR2FW15_9ROSI
MKLCWRCFGAAQYLVAELLFRAAKKNGMDFQELLHIPHGERRKYDDDDDVSVMVVSAEGRIWSTLVSYDQLSVLGNDKMEWWRSTKMASPVLCCAVPLPVGQTLSFLHLIFLALVLNAGFLFLASLPISNKLPLLSL